VTAEEAETATGDTSSHDLLPLKKITPAISGAVPPGLRGFLQDFDSRDRGTLKKHILALLAVAPHLLHTELKDKELKVLWKVKLKCFRQIVQLLKSRSDNDVEDAMLAAELGGLVALFGCVLFRASEASNDEISHLNAIFEKTEEGTTHKEKQVSSGSEEFLMRGFLRAQVQTPRKIIA